MYFLFCINKIQLHLLVKGEMRTRPGLSPLSPGSSAGQKRDPGDWRGPTCSICAEFRASVHPGELLGCILYFNWSLQFFIHLNPSNFNRNLKLFGFYSEGFYPHLLTFKPWMCQKLSRIKNFPNKCFIGVVIHHQEVLKQFWSQEKKKVHVFKQHVHGFFPADQPW